MNFAERQSLVTAKFLERFAAAPELWSRAPGRVDLMGSHTDYNLGYVMTMTIDRDTWIAARPRDDRKVAIYSLNVDGGSEFAALFEAACRERAHRTPREECDEVTPRSLAIAELNRELEAWERTYNTVRPHQSLGYLTPQQFLAQDSPHRKEPQCH